MAKEPGCRASANASRSDGNLQQKSVEAGSGDVRKSKSLDRLVRSIVSAVAREGRDENASHARRQQGQRGGKEESSHLSTEEVKVLANMVRRLSQGGSLSSSHNDVKVGDAGTTDGIVLDRLLPREDIPHDLVGGARPAATSPGVLKRYDSLGSADLWDESGEAAPATPVAESAARETTEEWALSEVTDVSSVTDCGLCSESCSQGGKRESSDPSAAEVKVLNNMARRLSQEDSARPSRNNARAGGAGTRDHVVWDTLLPQEDVPCVRSDALSPVPLERFYSLGSANLWDDAGDVAPASPVTGTSARKTTEERAPALALANAAPILSETNVSSVTGCNLRPESQPPSSANHPSSIVFSGVERPPVELIVSAKASETPLTSHGKQGSTTRETPSLARTAKIGSAGRHDNIVQDRPKEKTRDNLLGTSLGEMSLSDLPERFSSLGSADLWGDASDAAPAQPVVEATEVEEKRNTAGTPLIVKTTLVRSETDVSSITGSEKSPGKLNVFAANLETLGRGRGTKGRLTREMSAKSDEAVATRDDPAELEVSTRIDFAVAAQAAPGEEHSKGPHEPHPCERHPRTLTQSSSDHERPARPRSSSFSSGFVQMNADTLQGKSLKENCGDILEEGQDYLSQSLLVNVYAKLRELSMLGHASVRLVEIDCNSHQSVGRRKERIRLGSLETEDVPYLEDTLTAGAIVRAVLDEYEIFEASSELSGPFSRTSKAALAYDASLLADFKQLVEKSKIKQLNGVAEKVIRSLRQENLERQLRLKGVSSGLALSTTALSDGSGVLWRRRGSSSAKSHSFPKATWPQRKQAHIADHLNATLENSRDCFQEGSSLRNLLETGLEVVWFSDRHPVNAFDDRVAWY